jgi:uncharacterized membrane protein YphA (DoxX/SURF4 family)
MRTNPFQDAFLFLIEPKWTSLLFGAVLLAAVAVAVVAWRRDPAQRTLQNVWTLVTRLVIGGMWWQQSLWKPPPTYTTNADGTGGLRYWMEEMVKYAAFSGQSSFVKDVVLKHFYLFAPQVYFGEVAIAFSLVLGAFTRVGATLGFLMALNLSLGLYRAPHEWPWTYVFLVIVNGSFAVSRAGRALGVDALLAHRSASPQRPGLKARLVRLAT